MPSVIPAPHRTGPAPTSVRTAVRGAARVVAATVGAVLAGLVLALPAVHLPPPSMPSGLLTSVVASAPASLLAPVGTSPTSLLAPGVHRHGGATTSATVLTAVRDVRAGVVATADVLREHLAPPVVTVGVAPASSTTWVALAAVLAAALAGARTTGDRRRGPGRRTHLGPAPLRGPPALPAPAP